MRIVPVTFVDELLKAQIDFATQQLQAVPFWSVAKTEFDKIHSFVNSAKKVLLCTGASLSGKSTQLHDLVIKWGNAKSYTVIPIYIDLNKITDLRDQFISNYLQITYKLNDDQINVLKYHKDVVLLFDNYNKGTLANLFVTQSLADWQGKSIIVTSSNYLDGFSDHTACFIPYIKGKRCSKLFEELSLPLLNKEQIEQYFDQKLPLYKNEINNFPLSLLSHPFFLKLIVAELPRFKEELKDSKHRLYQFVVEKWFIAQEKQLQENGILNKTETIVQACFEYCHLIAEQMQQQKLSEIVYQPRSHVLSNKVSATVWDQFFNNSNLKTRRIKYACPFIFEQKHRYQFIANELIAFFSEFTIDKELSSLSELHADLQHIISQASSETNTRKRIDGLLAHPINKILLTQNANIMNLLADQIRQDKNFKLFLFDLIYASRNDKRLEIAAANAITALVYVKESFANLDLSGVNIKGADLQYGIFHNTKFIGADLTDVNFKNAYIVGADFSGATMHNVFFGELAFIHLDASISDCCFNFDGSLIAASLWNHVVVLIETKTQQIKFVLTGHTDVVEAVHFHPFKNLLASASRDETIRIWDITTGKLVLKIKDHLANINDVKFSPNGAYLASVSEDGTAIVRDTEKYECLRVFEGHKDKLSVLDIDSTSQYLVTADNNNAIKLWDIITGRCLRTYSRDNSSLFIHGIRFSPDNQYIAAGTSENEIDIWHVDSGECRLILKGHNEWVYGLDYSADGKHLISASRDKSVRMWSLETGSCDHILQGHTSSVDAVAYSPNQQLIISAGNDERIRFWPTKINKLEKQLQSHITNVECLAFSPNGMLLASGDEHIIRVWMANTGTCVLELKGHQKFCFKDTGNGGSHGWRGAITALKFTSDNQYLISSSNDLTIRVWNLKSGSCERILNGHEGSIKSIALNADNSRIISGGEDKKVKLWDLKTGNEIASFEGHTESIHCVCFSPDGLFAASCSGNTQVGIEADNVIRIWDLTLKECCAILKGHTKPVWRIAFTPDQKMLISLSSDNTLRLWYLDPNLIGNCEIIQDIRHKYGDPKLGSYSKNMMSGEESVEESGHIFIFTPDGKSLIFGEGLLPLRVFSLETYEIITTIKVDHTNLYTCQFHTNLQLATANNRDYSIRVWEPYAGDFPYNKWRLLWTSKMLLDAAQCKINDAIMSSGNYHLLKQRGAKGQARISDLHSSELDDLTKPVTNNNIPSDPPINLKQVDAIIENRLARHEQSSNAEKAIEIAKCWNDLAQTHLNNGNYDQAISCSMVAESLLIQEIEKNKVAIAVSQLNINLSYGSNAQSNDTQQKNDYVNKCSEELARCADLIGHALNKQRNINEAIASYERSIRIRNEIVESIPEELSYRNKTLYHFRIQLLLDLANTLFEIGLLRLPTELDEALSNINEGYEVYDYYCTRLLWESEYPRISKIKSVLMNYGNDLFFKGDLLMARKCYAAIKLDFIDQKTHLRMVAKCYPESDYNTAINHCEIIKKLFPDFISINHNMGCYYHVKGLKENDLAAIKKSEECYLTALSNEVEDKTQVKVEYALFLIKQQREAEAIPYLELAIDITPISAELHYGQMERIRLPSDFSDELVELDDVKIKTKILAYYLLCLAYLNTSQRQKIVKISDQFIDCVNHEKDALSCSLLGYICLKINGFETAKQCFEIALQLNKYYATAKKNVELCQQQLDFQEKFVQLDEPLIPIEAVDEPANQTESEIVTSASLLTDNPSTLFYRPADAQNEQLSEEELKQLQDALALSLEPSDNSQLSNARK